MSTLPKEVLRSIIVDGGLQTSDDVHTYLKELFKDKGNIIFEESMYRLQREYMIIIDLYETKN